MSGTPVLPVPAMSQVSHHFLCLNYYTGASLTFTWWEHTIMHEVPLCCFLINTQQLEFKKKKNNFQKSLCQQDPSFQLQSPSSHLLLRMMVHTHLFIQLFIEYLLCARHVLGTEDIAGTRMDKSPCPVGLPFQRERLIRKEIY